jgi:DNA-binding transcriptional ArsR family regulator
MSDFDVCIRRLRALAEPARLRIVTLLMGSPSTVSEMAARTGLPVTAASYHLCILHEVGVVARRPEGRNVVYSLPPQVAERTAGEPSVIDLGYWRLRIPWEQGDGELAAPAAVDQQAGDSARDEESPAHPLAD